MGKTFGEGDGDTAETLPVDDYPDGPVASYFEKEDNRIFVYLGAVFLDLK